MKTRIGIIFAGALAFAMLSGHGEALARPGHGWHGGGHGHHGGGHGWHGGGWHGGGWHGGGWHGGGHGWHGGWRHGGWRGGWARPPVWRPRPYGWYGPRRVFAPYPVVVGPRFGYGFAPGCTVRRSVGFAPGGWRKIVTVRTCYVR